MANENNDYIDLMLHDDFTSFSLFPYIEPDKGITFFYTLQDYERFVFDGVGENGLIFAYPMTLVIAQIDNVVNVDLSLLADLFEETKFNIHLTKREMSYFKLPINGFTVSFMKRKNLYNSLSFEYKQLVLNRLMCHVYMAMITYKDKYGTYDLFSQIKTLDDVVEILMIYIDHIYNDN